MKRKLGVNALLISHAERNAKPVDTLNVYKSLYTLKSIANALVRGGKKKKKKKLYAFVLAYSCYFALRRIFSLQCLCCFQTISVVI